MASATAAGRRYKRMARRCKKVEQRRVDKRNEDLKAEQMERALLGEGNLMCLSEGLDAKGYTHFCVRPVGHGGAHISGYGQAW